MSWQVSRTNVLMTLNKRLDTAAAAMVQRMIKRSSPRVLRAVSPFNKGSIELEAMFEELEKSISPNPLYVKTLQSNCPLGKLRINS